jgi:4-hydroxy-tetrahydrodipicolinate synthase
MMEVYNLLFTENNPAGVKAFLYEMGLVKNIVRLPVTPLSESVHQKIKAYCKK